MEAFPPNFNLDSLRAIGADRSTAYGEAQHKLLEMTRQRVYDHVTSKAAEGETDIEVQVPGMLCNELTRRLASELAQRFPNCVSYWYVFERGDVEEWRVVDPLRPVAAERYRISLN